MQEFPEPLQRMAPQVLLQVSVPASSLPALMAGWAASPPGHSTAPILALSGLRSGGGAGGVMPHVLSPCHAFLLCHSHDCLRSIQAVSPPFIPTPSLPPSACISMPLPPCKLPPVCGSGHACWRGRAAGVPLQMVDLSQHGGERREGEGEGHASGDVGRASHGLESIIEILGFIVSLITTKDDDAHPHLAVFGLELMHTALQAGGSGGHGPCMQPPGSCSSRCLSAAGTAAVMQLLRHEHGTGTCSAWWDPAEVAVYLQYGYSLICTPSAASLMSDTVKFTLQPPSHAHARACRGNLEMLSLRM